MTSHLEHEGQPRVSAMFSFPSFPKPSLDSIQPILRQFEPAQGFPRGTELFPQSAPSEGVFVLKSGIVQLQWTGADGAKALLALRMAGAMLGAPAAVAEIPYVVSAIAATRCDAWRLPRQAFNDLLRGETVFSWYHHQLQAHENLMALWRIAAMGYLSARQRFELLLEEISAAPAESSSPGAVPLRDQDLAKLIGITPTYLSRLIKKLVAEGRLSRVQGGLVVNEPAI